jgi:hypothetical protein
MICSTCRKPVHKTEIICPDCPGTVIYYHDNAMDSITCPHPGLHLEATDDKQKEARWTSPRS